MYRELYSIELNGMEKNNIYINIFYVIYIYIYIFQVIYVYIYTHITKSLGCIAQINIVNNYTSIKLKINKKIFITHKKAISWRLYISKHKGQKTETQNGPIDGKSCPGVKNGSKHMG